MSLRARGQRAASRTSPCFEAAGQASVEAALFLPVMMLLMAMLLQPAFLLYTRSVMQQAASEGLRVLATRPSDGSVSEEACASYVERRLGAIPDVAAFHAGEWEVSCAGDSSAGEASVEVVGHMRPLPIVGILASMLGESDGDGVVLRVSVSERTRPGWLEGDYEGWVSMWG